MTGTKYKQIVLTFNKELTEEQEDTLIASFQYITEKAKTQLQKTQRGYSSINNFFLGEQGKVIKRTIEHALENFDTMFILDKEDSDPKTYIFKMRTTLNALSISFGFIKLDYWEKLRNVYLKFFDSQVLPQLKLKKSDVKISF